MREITDSRRFQPITGQQLDIEPAHINQEILQSRLYTQVLPPSCLALLATRRGIAYEC